MTDFQVTFATVEDARDAMTFVQRAAHLGCEFVQLRVEAETLLLTVAVFSKQGLLDTTPLVLAVRGFSVTPTTPVENVVVLLRGLTDRLAHDSRGFDLPVTQPGVPWSGVSPPRDGWMIRGELDSREVAEAAIEGIAAVAAANGLGAKAVETARAATWFTPLIESGDELSLPRGVAFAAYGLGLISSESTEMLGLSFCVPWVRLQTRHGNILSRT